MVSSLSELAPSRMAIVLLRLSGTSPPTLAPAAASACNNAKSSNVTEEGNEVNNDGAPAAAGAAVESVVPETVMVLKSDALGVLCGRRASIKHKA